MRSLLAILLVFVVACSGDATVAPIVETDPPGPTYPGADAAGLDGELIYQLVSQANSDEWGQIQSILISRGGELVVEEYYRGTTAEDANQVYSVTKSIASALFGIAHYSDQIGSLEDTLPIYFPGYTISSEAQSITLENLLTMRAGFEWDEWTVPYGGAANSATALSRSGDALEYMFSLPLSDSPGVKFTYSSGVSILIGAAIEQATGGSTSELADATLFEQLNFGSPQWDRTSSGTTNTGWGLHLTPRQMLDFGVLFENHGFWNGVEVVPRAWVGLSTSQHTTTSNGLAYGFQWWRFRPGDARVEPLDQNDVYFAWGYGGQFIFVVPHKDTVIVMTAANFDDSSPAFDMLRRFIFPALL